MNPISILSTSFSDILTDLNNDPRTADANIFWKLGFSGFYAVLTLRLNVTANQVLIGTAEDRTIAEDVLAWQDYRMQGKAPAAVPIDIVVTSGSVSGGPLTIPASELVALRPGAVGTPNLQYEARESLTFPQFSTTGVFTAYQQTTKSQVAVGTTTSANSQIFRLPDLDVIPETLTLLIGADTYYAARVFFDRSDDSFAYASSTDPVFVFKSDTDGNSYVILGFTDAVDGTQYGKLPAIGLTVYATYAVGGGTIGNVLASKITQYIGGNPAVVSVNNPSAALNGTEAETLSNAKQIAPLRARTHDMFWDDSSGVAIAQSVSGVLFAGVTIDGLLTATCAIMPVGGGTASQPLIDAVYAQLIEQSFFKQINLTVQSVSYLYIGISVGIAMLEDSPVSFATAKRNMALAISLRSHETAFYIHQYYDDNGMVQGLIDIINSTISTLAGYTYTLDQDGSIINSLLARIPFNTFGSSFGPEDLDALALFVPGVSYMSSFNPSSRVIPASTVIIKPSTLEISQI